MRRAELAKQLIATTDMVKRRQLLTENPRLADTMLAREIRKISYGSWTVDPAKTQNAADALSVLTKFDLSPETAAIERWVKGISDITRGRFEPAVIALTSAADTLNTVGLESDAAQAQVAKLLALAMLGRYDEAIETGNAALKIFITSKDDLAAGKIEMNLSNIVSRRSEHREAERYCRSALRRFVRVSEKSWQAMAENGLANTYSELNDFKKAEKFYKSALSIAEVEKMPVTEAEIGASLGTLALMRGQYPEALAFLEASRQKYAELGMPHQSAIADLEMADIYADLNLVAESMAIYEHVSAAFKKLKLRAEEARSRLNFGRLAGRIGNTALAKRQLKRALDLFVVESNISGQASVLLTQTEVASRAGDLKTVSKVLRAAATLIGKAENPRHVIALKLFEGSAFLRSGDTASASSTFVEVLRLAQTRQESNAQRIALNSLGKLAVDAGNSRLAQRYFSKAIKIVESTRRSFQADEFSISFFASRLEPFQNLAQLFIANGKIAKAFETIEMSRSRSLLDSIGKVGHRTPVSVKLIGRQAEIRSELNFYYKKLESVAADEIDRLRETVASAESGLTEITRQINSLSGKKSAGEKKDADFSLKNLHEKLGTSTVLIEFIEYEGKISAFALGGGKIRFIPEIATSHEITKLLQDLHFQFGSLRYGSVKVTKFADKLRARTDRCLSKLYELLIMPLQKHLTGGRLVIVPSGPLNHVPFPALFDGKNYLVERYEITLAPSAAVWNKLKDLPTRKINSSALFAFADERIPLVEAEVAEIGKFVPKPKMFTGSNASVAAYFENSRRADLIHLACHGQFRGDNPLYSSLHLADGWITVRDIAAQQLRASLVVLSACETGISQLFAGDEILGLSRGFIRAGASSLIVSLWTVNDTAAAEFMKLFYSSLQRKASIAASLRSAQVEFIRRGGHPYLWSPFILIGK